jgi:uncharacterized protein YcfJ
MIPCNKGRYMRNKFVKSLLASSAMIALLTGCTGSEAVPNNATQTGAVTGALAGSMIGYNTGSHSGTNAVIGGLLGAAVGGGIGNAVDNNNQAQQPSGGWQ